MLRTGLGRKAQPILLGREVIEVSLRVRQFGNVDIVPGAILEGLDQGKILSNFSCFYPTPTKSVTAIYLRTEENPLSLAFDISDFKAIVNRYSDIWKKHFCLQLGSNIENQEFIRFEIDRIFPAEGCEIEIADMSHLVAHLLLSYAQRFREPFIDKQALHQFNFTFQELAYPNANNVFEGVVVLNFPTWVGSIGKLTEEILWFIDGWSKGDNRPDFIDWMKELTESLEKRFHYP